MKNPRMLRPMLILGIVVIAVALLSFFLNPRWSSSPLAIGVVLLAILVGVIAVIRDMQAFVQEVKNLQKKE